jgi:alkylhydroperoxidase family enzyme
MRIALINECEVCRNARVGKGERQGLDEAFYGHVHEWRTWTGYSERERLAAQYAERFVLDHVRLREDTEFWKRLRENFSDAEIVDLAICCGLWLGGGRLMRVLDVGQVCAVELPGAAA